MKLKSQNYLGYMFVLPGILFIFIFMIYPMISCIIYSFLNMDLTESMNNFSFIALDNYISLIKDNVFWISTLNSFIFVLATVLFHQIFGMILAILMDKEISGKLLFRGINLLPWAISGVSVALIWSWIFHPQLGVLNDILLKTGLINKPAAFLSDPNTALLSVLIAHNWRTIPFTFIMLLAGLQNIPKHYYESASIDGATALQQFFLITIPQMFKIILTVGILDLIWTFVYFDLPYVMTKGGPIHATELMPTYVYELSFQFYNFGKGSALSVYIFLINMVFTFLYITYYGKANNNE